MPRQPAHVSVVHVLVECELVTRTVVYSFSSFSGLSGVYACSLADKHDTFIKPIQATYNQKCLHEPHFHSVGVCVQNDQLETSRYRFIYIDHVRLLEFI